MHAAARRGLARAARRNTACDADSHTCMRINLQQSMQLCNGCSSAAPDRRGQHAAVTRPYRCFPHILSILWGFGTFTDAAVSSRGEVGDDFLGWRKANLPHATYTSQNGTASTASYKLTMPDAENISDCVWTGFMLIIPPVFTLEQSKHLCQASSVCARN